MSSSIFEELNLTLTKSAASRAAADARSAAEIAERALSNTSDVSGLVSFFISTASAKVLSLCDGLSILAGHRGALVTEVGESRLLAPRLPFGDVTGFSEVGGWPRVFGSRDARTGAAICFGPFYIMNYCGSKTKSDQETKSHLKVQ